MAYQFHSVTVLVVEDNAPMLDITKSLLMTFGVGQVIGARNGQEGFERFCEYNPDLIVADWMMRPMDGISFARLVRNDPRSPNPYVPIILMTGFSERRRVIQARDAGVTEFLVKPFNARDLYRRISQIVERPRQFVRSPDFFGPDRRRKANPSFSSPQRRETDVGNNPLISDEQKRQMQVQQQEAHEHLRRIREQAGLGRGDKFNLDKLDINSIDLDLI